MMEGFGHMGFSWIFGLILIIIGVWFIVNLVNKNKPDNFSNSTESALDILKKRYARGEISKDEFVEMKNTLIDKN